MIKATNPFTGEVFELEDKTPSDLETAYKFLKTFEKTIKSMQEQWKKRVNAIADNGQVETPTGVIRVIPIQRQTYDKGALRGLVDEDTLDTFLVVKKSLVDEWLAERVLNQDLDMDTNHAIRSCLIDDGLPYVQVKYDKR